MVLAHKTGVGAINKHVMKERVLHDLALYEESDGLLGAERKVWLPGTAGTG